MEVGRSIAKKKPVIVIKGGMAGCVKATMSHIVSLAGSLEAFRAVAGIYLPVPYLTQFLGERLAELQRELIKPLISFPEGCPVTSCGRAFK